jgi:hypothetical protein
MTYLELVQKAMEKSGIRSASPTSVVGAVDISKDFVNWVADAWRELQEESTNWFFRQRLDQTLAITASVDAYAMPDDLETLNYRTITIYTTAKQDETPVTLMPYETWRVQKDTLESAEGRPCYITERPDGSLQLWPVPDQAYTLRYDGVWDIDEMLLDSDTPGSNRTGGTTLPERYQWLLVYDAVRRHYEHHEDTEGVRKANPKYLAQRARLSEKQTPPITIKKSSLTH